MSDNYINVAGLGTVDLGRLLIDAQVPLTEHDTLTVKSDAMSEILKILVNDTVPYEFDYEFVKRFRVTR